MHGLKDHYFRFISNNLFNGFESQHICLFRPFIVITYFHLAERSRSCLNNKLAEMKSWGICPHFAAAPPLIHRT